MPDVSRQPCPLCGSARLAPLHHITRFAVPFDVVRCLECSLLHVNPQPRPDVLDALYDADYYAGKGDFHYADERKLEPQVRVRAAGRLARVERMLADDGVRTRRVVEIGSAFGVFLDEARRRGWDVRGCEISPESASYAEEHFELPISRCDLADADLAPASADLVTGSEVIEHLVDPVRTARAAFDVLAPGGIVLFSTANEASLAYLARGERWEYIQPGHVVLWSARTLTELLRRRGFVDIRMTAGDERGLANYLTFRRTAGAGSVLAWLVKRLGLGHFTVGAGMVVQARKPRSDGRR